jgi:hypothetical protein
MSRAKTAALLLLSFCLAIGGATHVFDIASGGLLPYRFAPLPINAFWSSLAVIDFVAILLLWTHRNLGLLTALGIMLMDVAVNSYTMYVLNLFPSFIPLQLQTLFLGFVLGCITFLWSRTVNDQVQRT